MLGQRRYIIVTSKTTKDDMPNRTKKDQRTKRCSGCTKYLPVQAFSKNLACKDGLDCYCRSCTKQKNDSYYALNKRQVRKRYKQYWKKERHWLSKQPYHVYSGQSWRKRASRRAHLKAEYGLSSQQVDLMIQERKGLCDICCLPEPVRGRRLAVDHVHGSTPVLVRGCSVTCVTRE